jgi:hypothetical protein
MTEEFETVGFSNSHAAATWICTEVRTPSIQSSRAIRELTVGSRVLLDGCIHLLDHIVNVLLGRVRDARHGTVVCFRLSQGNTQQGLIVAQCCSVTNCTILATRTVETVQKVRRNKENKRSQVRARAKANKMITCTRPSDMYMYQKRILKTPIKTRTLHLSELYDSMALIGTSHTQGIHGDVLKHLVFLSILRELTSLYQEGIVVLVLDTHAGAGVGLYTLTDQDSTK